MAHKSSLCTKDLDKNYSEIDTLNQYIHEVCSYFLTKNRLNLLNPNYQKLVDNQEDA